MTVLLECCTTLDCLCFDTVISNCKMTSFNSLVEWDLCPDFSLQLLTAWLSFCASVRLSVILSESNKCYATSCLLRYTRTYTYCVPVLVCWRRHVDRWVPGSHRGTRERRWRRGISVCRRRADWPSCWRRWRLITHQSASVVQWRFRQPRLVRRIHCVWWSSGRNRLFHSVTTLVNV